MLSSHIWAHNAACPRCSRQGGHTTDVSDSVAMLCEQNIRPYLEPMQEIFDSDVFRKERLYKCVLDPSFPTPSALPSHRSFPEGR